MKTGAAVGLALGGTAIAAVIVYLIEEHSKKPTQSFLHPLNIFSGSSASLHDQMQTAITNQIAANSAHYAQIKVGGAHGVPGNSRTVKPIVFQDTISASGLHPSDSWDRYNYPGLILNESAGDGLGRDQVGGGFNFGNVLSGAFTGFMTGGPVGAFAGAGAGATGLDLGDLGSLFGH